MQASNHRDVGEALQTVTVCAQQAAREAERLSVHAFTKKLAEHREAIEQALANVPRRGFLARLFGKPGFRMGGGDRMVWNDAARKV